MYLCFMVCTCKYILVGQSVTWRCGEVGVTYIYVLNRSNISNEGMECAVVVVRPGAADANTNTKTNMMGDYRYRLLPAGHQSPVIELGSGVFDGRCC